MERARVDEARLIRAVRLRAVHHYRRAGWSEEENRRAFGAQAETHAHDWRVEVHVAGPVDPATGWCVDLGALDAHLAAVTAGWDGGALNALDITKLERIIAGLDAWRPAADANSDGALNALDITKTARLVAGLP